MNAQTTRKSLMQNDFVRLTLVLFLISFLVAAILGVVNGVTKDRIAAQAESDRLEAMRQVLPGANSFDELATPDGLTGITAICAAKSNSLAVGWTVQAEVQGFGGVISLIVGFDTDRAVTGVVIVSASETPGLGMKAADASFTNQYIGKTGAIEVVRGASADTNSISAISGATVTSKAVTKGVQAAIDAVGALK